MNLLFPFSLLCAPTEQCHLVEHLERCEEKPHFGKKTDQIIGGFLTMKASDFSI